MNLETLRAEIQALGHRNSVQQDAAISKAFRDTRNKETWFNGARFSLTLQSGVESYPLPNDFLGMRGAVWLYPSGSVERRKELVYTTIDDLERLRFHDSDWGSEAQNEFLGEAMAYTIDRIGKSIIFAPTPDSSSDVVKITYTRDFGTPTYTASSATSPALSVTVTLLGPDGETLPATFTNPWLKHGFDALLHRACFWLAGGPHGGTAESREKAQFANAMYEQELQRLREETAAVQSSVSVTGWM